MTNTAPDEGLQIDQIIGRYTQLDSRSKASVTTGQQKQTDVIKNHDVACTIPSTTSGQSCNAEAISTCFLDCLN
jgi:hypothetical protein